MQQGSLKPEGYVPRVSDRVLAELLEIFPAVEVAGTMWCGKTWMSLSFGESVTRVGRAAVKRAVEADPTIALVGERPHVIDEWQDVPAIWDAVRDAVDDGAVGRGGVILTGSSSPRKELVSHSGAGRIAKMRMRTMSLMGNGESSGAVSLAGLFEGAFEPGLFIRVWHRWQRWSVAGDGLRSGTRRPTRPLTIWMGISTRCSTLASPARP